MRTLARSIDPDGRDRLVRRMRGAGRALGLATAAGAAALSAVAAHAFKGHDGSAKAAIAMRPDRGAAGRVLVRVPAPQRVPAIVRAPAPLQPPAAPPAASPPAPAPPQVPPESPGQSVPPQAPAPAPQPAPVQTSGAS